MALSGVTIVLSTYNGAAFVEAFVESLREQSFRDWRLLVRDDASSDATRAILDELAQRDPRIHLLPYDGRNLGAPASFGVLLAAARDQDARYVFLADQDDVWLPDKLQRLLAVMVEAEADTGPGVPVLVYSDLIVVADDLRVIHPSFRRYQRLHLPPPAAMLQTLLTQNVVTGCVSLLNRALLDAVVPVPERLAMHDWWVAQCAAAAGVIVDVDEPTVLYRQHVANVLGAKGGAALLRNALWRPGQWWARGRRNFLLGVSQASALARRLEEYPLTEHTRRTRPLVAAYCAALGSDSTPFGRLRRVLHLGTRPTMLLPRLLYYARVMLYGSPKSVATLGPRPAGRPAEGSL